MKFVIAYIKSNRLGKVVHAMHRIEGLTGVSVTDVHGFGRGRGEGQAVYITEDSIHYVPHKKLEIFCRDDLVDMVVEAIRTAAHTGLRGDGKVYVLDAEQAYRISSGETGNAAI